MESHLKVDSSSWWPGSGREQERENSPRGEEYLVGWGRLKPMFHNVSRTYPIQSRVFCYSKNKAFEDLKVSEIMFSSSPLPILNRSHPLGKVKGQRQEDFCIRVESLGQNSQISLAGRSSLWSLSMPVVCWILLTGCRFIHL